MSRKKQNLLSRNLEKTIIQYIQGKRYVPLTEEELISHLKLPSVHIELVEKILQNLISQGTLILLRGRYHLPQDAAQIATGTISVHPKGFAFVKTGTGPDVFIPKHSVFDAVDGDTVEIEIASEVSAKGPEGAVVSILKRGRSQVAGTIVSASQRHFHAYSPLLGPDKPVIVKAEKGMTLKEGDRVICQVTNWHNSDDLIEGVATSLIGHISDPSIDITAAIEEFEIPNVFQPQTIAEARKFGKKVGLKEIQSRKDLTHLESVTIDPDTARDYDDAISLECDSRGHFHLGVHIADVAHYVKPDTQLDKEAFLRCNSTYFPGKCTPMLPEELSNELCSLKPKVIRLTQSVLAEFDPSGTLVHYEICRSAIKSQKRFTYKEALQVLLKKKKNIHAPLLERMTQLCALLKVKRMERGSIDFAMTDHMIIVDENGIPQKFEKIEYDVTHQMIEEFALKANEIVATHLTKKGKSVIFRIHEEPNPESFQDFFAFARTLGFTLPPKPTQKDIQKLFADAKDSPFIHQLNVSFIRSMRLACYSPENIGHYGLSLEYYCHFTSPIRRYTDLIVQRILFDELPAEIDLTTVAATCSLKERVSFKAESSVVLLKKLRYAQRFFEEEPTRIYPAVITKVKPFALYFEIPEFDLEGSLHISQIGNDYYEFNAARMEFRGSRTGVYFSPGQSIQVRLDKIDLIQLQSQWSIVQAAANERPRKKRK